MPKRKIRRRTGEGISISGPATVHVMRGVTLVIDAPRDARVARISRNEKRKPSPARPPSPTDPPPPCQGN
ncbi:MAG TPA: hypothetical protein VGM05_19860 [Planctomycetaceae bacterium]